VALRGIASLVGKDVLDRPAGFRFGVEIQGIVVGWFTECSGLSIEREVYPYQEGGQNAYVHQLPGRVKSANITLKHGIADQALWKWFREGLYNLQVERHNLSIILYGVDFAETERWDLTDAFPLKWTGPELKTDDNQVAVEALTVGQGSASTSSSVQRARAEGHSSGQTMGVLEADQEEVVGPAVDVPLLADKVFDLLKQELRWERERLGWKRSW
jgi:phage tail-like protein